jgi:hypothetical protein
MEAVAMERTAITVLLHPFGPAMGRALRAAAGSSAALQVSTTHFIGASEMPHGGCKHIGCGKDLSMYAEGLQR